MFLVINKSLLEIKEIIFVLYSDLYGKSVPTEEITKIYRKEQKKNYTKIMNKFSRKAKKKKAGKK